MKKQFKKQVDKQNEPVVYRRDIPYNFRPVTSEEHEAWRVPQYGYIL